MFRTARMVWVDLLVDPDGFGMVLESLAAAGILEPCPHAGTPPFAVASESVRGRLEDLARRIQPVQSWLPPPEPGNGTQTDVEDVVASIERDFRDWLAATSPVIAAAQAARADIAELRLLEQALSALPEDAVNFTAWPRPGENRVFASFLAIGPEAVAGVAASTAEASRSYPCPAQEGIAVVLGVIASPQLPGLERQMHARGLRFISVPAGLHGPVPEALAQVRALLVRAENRLGREHALLDRASREFRIARAHWLLRRCLWAHRVLGESAYGGRHFVWLGGWTPLRRLRELKKVLRASGVACLLNVEPENARPEPPPVELFNPPFARGFEVFVRAFGVPMGNELDPSPALAVLMPLLFGYMFGDVGHGLLLALFGRYAGRRQPVLKLLVPAGLSSAVFGWLYGEIFGLEHVILALGWHPLEDPMLTLLLPLALGALVLLIGFVFEALQLRAAGDMRNWWRAEFPVLVLYLGVLAVPLDPLWTGLGALAALTALVMTARGPAALAAELVEVLHALMQLLVNTISFMRVGAFALAHAGLSAAVGMLAQIPEGVPARTAVWLLGNALVIGLEGLVVSVQTTRLMLFEFFRRFLRGGGRPFRPLTLPPELALHSPRASSALNGVST